MTKRHGKRMEDFAIRVNKPAPNANGNAAVVRVNSPRRVELKFYEAGSEGIKEYSGFISEAYNTQLYWPTVQPLYSRLRRSMPEIVMIRNAFTAWARNVRPIVELPDSPTDDDRAYQDFIESDFENMEGGFPKFIDTLVNQVPFMGWGWWEVLLSIRDPRWRPPGGEDDWESEADDGLIGIRRLAWRDSSTFAGWVMSPKKKKLLGMKQQDWPNEPVTLKLSDSLHITFGDPHNPEGLTPLEAVWRKERMKYGYEVIHGIGSEHAAGHLSVTKTEEGVLSGPDKDSLDETAKNLLSAQEGNFAYWPYGLDGSIIDVPFQAANALLDMIKHLSIEVLSMYDQQWIALNTMTKTGAQASQVDSTDSGVFFFNSMIDGFASQYDQQVGKKLYRLNKANFPNMTKRPIIKFSHIDRAIALADLGNFFSTINGIMPLTDDDFKELRRRSGFLPVNVDITKEASAAQAADVSGAQGKVTNNMSEFGGDGSGNFNHAGRIGMVGGSASNKERESDVITIPVSKVHPTEKSVITTLPKGPFTKSSETEGLTGHGFRWMGKAEFKKFVDGKLKYGGVAENELEKGIMFQNVPGDFFYGGGKKGIYLIEVNVQGVASGLLAPKGSVGLDNVVGAWYYNPKSGYLENVIVEDD